MKNSVSFSRFRSMANFMEYVELILKATPAWPYVRQQLIYQNLFAELVNDAANLSIGESLYIHGMAGIGSCLIVLGGSKVC